MLISQVFIILLTMQLFLMWVYLTFFREKLYIELSETSITEYVGYFEYCLLLRIILCCMVAYVTLKIVFELPSSGKFKVFGERLQSISKILEKCNVFYITYDIIFKKFGTGSTYVIFVIAAAKRILDYSQRKNMIIICCCVILPRIIILLVFLVEIWLNQLHYYFYALGLLLIPIMFRMLLFMFKDVRRRVFPEAQSMVMQKSELLTINGTPSVILIFKMRPEYHYIDEDAFLEDEYYPLLYINAHIDIIVNLYMKFNLITLFFYHLCHIMGFIYILGFLI